jgi:hypothetical protein
VTEIEDPKALQRQFIFVGQDGPGFDGATEL